MGAYGFDGRRIMTNAQGGTAFTNFYPGAFPAPAFAPYSSTYATRQPYITAAEYTASPTGMSVTDIAPGQSTQVNADALLQTIARASSRVDEMCDQILAATIETEVGLWQVQNGMVMIPVQQSPVIAVYQVALGESVSTMAPIYDYSNVDIGRKVVQVPFGGIGFGPIRASITYVAGFANSSITAATTVTGLPATISVDSILGIVAGMSLTIFDPGATEVVTVALVNGGSIVTVNPLQHAHAVGVNISALPARVKQATVLLTTALLKTRAAQAIVLHSSRTTPQTQQATAPGMHNEEIVAKELLRGLGRVA